MSKEYVEREVAIKAIENDCLELAYYTKEDAIQCVKAIPAANVVEVRYGKWIHSEIEDDDWGGTFHEWTCSVCGYSVGYNPTGENYCSNCGARMGQITHWVPLPESPKEK